jgi:hypothetical protein
MAEDEFRLAVAADHVRLVRGQELVLDELVEEILAGADKEDVVAKGGGKFVPLLGEDDPLFDEAAQAALGFVLGVEVREWGGVGWRGEIDGGLIECSGHGRLRASGWSRKSSLPD